MITTVSPFNTHHYTVVYIYTHKYNWKFVPLDHLHPLHTHTHHPPFLATTNLVFVSIHSVFVVVVYIPHTSEITQYLSFAYFTVLLLKCNDAREAHLSENRGHRTSFPSKIKRQGKPTEWQLRSAHPERKLSAETLTWPL